MISPRAVIVALAVGAFATRALAAASWLPNGVPVAATPDYEFSPNIVPDGLGGAFVVWVNYGANAGTYALDLDENGAVRPGWPSGGLLLPELAGETDPFMASDDHGGAFVAATGTASVGFRHLLAPTGGAQTQRALSGGSGGPRSTTAVPSRDLASSSEILSIVTPDGVGGAFVSFTERQRFYDLGAVRHYAADGSFTALSLSVLTGCGDYLCSLDSPTVCPDGAGGAFVAWSQGCGARVLRLTPQLTPAAGWPPSGVPAGACSMSNPYVGACADGGGGVFVVWQGYPTYSHPLRVLHLTPAGTVASGWSSDGLELSSHPTLPGYQRPYYGAFSSVVPDGFGGALVTWTDERADTGDVYVQRVRGDGTIAPGWSPDGVEVGIAPGMQENPVVAADGAGGAVVAWQDEEHAPDFEIRANRVDAAGASLGGSQGLVVSAGPGSGLKIFPRIASDGGQGAFIVWVDYRQGNGDIYASHFPDPPVSVPSAPAIAIEPIRPNPSHGAITCRIDLHGSESAWLELIDVAGRVWVRREVGSLGSGAHEVTIQAPRAMGSGVFFVRLTHAGEAHVSRVSILR